MGRASTGDVAVRTRKTDTDLWAALAVADPGILRTVDLLFRELASAELTDDVLRGVGEELRQLGDELVERADRVVVDQPVTGGAR